MRWVRRGLVLLVSLAVLDYLVLPQIAGTRRALDLLHDIRPWWVALGVALEAMSLVCYSLLTRSLLPGRRPHFGWLIRSDITALGVSHVLPGGSATSTALRFRLLHDGGAPAEDAAVGLAVEAVGSTLALVAVFWLALVASIPFVGFNPLYLTAAVVGAVLIGAAGFGILRLSQQEAPGTSLLRLLIPHLPNRFRSRVSRAVERGSDQLRLLLSSRSGLRGSARWATGNWAFDAASLWVFLAAYGHRMNPGELLVAYGLANLLATLPISPGGLGVIEGVLIPSLVGFGTPSAVAVLGVISWRLFEFWAPIPVAGICYLSLRIQGRLRPSELASQSGGPQAVRLPARDLRPSRHDGQ
jgi:uncharacterized protein (TIRG00374 family)